MKNEAYLCAYFLTRPNTIVTASDYRSNAVTKEFKDGDYALSVSSPVFATAMKD